MADEKAAGLVAAETEQPLSGEQKENAGADHAAGSRSRAGSVDLLTLSQRVEEAAGPSRELDALIVTTLCPGATVGEYVGYEDVVFHAESIGIPNKEICPFFTASIDAAMLLVPSEERAWNVRIERDDDVWGAAVWHPFESRPDIGRWFGSAALALTAAALRARSSQEK